MTAVDSSSLRLSCLILDEKRDVLTPVFAFDAPPSADITQLREEIYKKLPPAAAAHVSVTQLDLWKLSKDIFVGTTEAEFEKAISQLKLSDEETSDDLKLLKVNEELSTYWKESPKLDCIHVIARVPWVDDDGRGKKCKRDETESAEASKRGDGTEAGIRSKPPQDPSITRSKLNASKRPGCSSRPRVSKLAQEVWESTWAHHGRGIPFCEKREVGRDGTLLDDSVNIPKSCWIMKQPASSSWLNLPPNGALIRDDDINALRALFTAAGYDTSRVSWPDLSNEFTNPFLDVQAANQDSPKRRGGFILTGHTGIGKSVWLRILLVLRLHAKLPTFFQRSAGSLYYFGRNGAKLIDRTWQYFQFLELFRRDKTAWVLLDFDDRLTFIPEFFYESGAFVVQTTSPRMDRLEWRRKAIPRPPLFILQPWSLPELLMGRQPQICPYTESQIAEYFRQYGPSTRKVYGTPSEMQEEILDNVCSGTQVFEQLRRLVNQAGLLQLEDYLYNDVLVLYPGETRSEPDLTIASRRVYNKLVAALGGPLANAPAKLFALFNSSRYAKGAAAFVLEQIIRSLLIEGGQWPIYALGKSPISCPAYRHWITPQNKVSSRYYLRVHSDGIQIGAERTQQTSQATCLPEFEFGPWTKKLQTGFYRSVSRDQATYFIYDERQNHAIVFQPTLSSTHSLSELEIQSLRKLGVTKFSYLLPRPASSEKEKADFSFSHDIDELIPDKYLFFLDSM